MGVWKWAETSRTAGTRPQLWGGGATRQSSGELGLIGRLGMVPPSALGAARGQQRPAVVVVVALHHARVVVFVEDLLLLLPVERLHQAQHHGGQRVLARDLAWLRDERVGLHPVHQEVGPDLALLLADALDVDLAAVLEGEAALLQDLVGLLGDLDLAADAGAVHAAGQVHRLAPDVVLRLLGADDAGHHRAVGHTWREMVIAEVVIKNERKIWTLLLFW